MCLVSLAQQDQAHSTHLLYPGLPSLLSKRHFSWTCLFINLLAMSDLLKLIPEILKPTTHTLHRGIRRDSVKDCICSANCFFLRLKPLLTLHRVSPDHSCPWYLTVTAPTSNAIYTVCTHLLSATRGSPSAHVITHTWLHFILHGSKRYKNQPFP
jgi:hypothetical protein